MKLTIARDALLPLLRRAAACTSPRSTDNGAKVIRLSAASVLGAGHVLTVGGTDYVLSFLGEASAETLARPGACAVDAKELLGRAELLPAGLVTLDLLGTKLSLRGPRGSRAFTLPALPVKGLSAITLAPDAVNVLTTTGAALAALFTRVIWAPDAIGGTDWTTVVRFARDRSSIGLDASSNTKGIVLDHPCAVSEAEPWEGCLAAEAVRALLAFAQAAGPAEVRLARDASSLLLTGPTSTIGARLVSAQLPNIRGLVETSSKEIVQEVVVPRRAFLEAVKAVRLGGSIENPGVYLVATPGTLHVVAEAEGNAHDRIATSTPIAAPVWAQYDASALLAAASALLDDDVSLAFNGGAARVLLMTETAKDCSSTSYVAGMVKHRSAIVDALVAGTFVSPEDDAS